MGPRSAAGVIQTVGRNWFCMPTCQMWVVSKFWAADLVVNLIVKRGPPLDEPSFDCHLDNTALPRKD